MNGKCTHRIFSLQDRSINKSYTPSGMVSQNYSNIKPTSVSIFDPKVQNFPENSGLKLQNPHYVNYSFEEPRVPLSNHSLVPHMQNYLEERNLERSETEPDLVDNSENRSPNVFYDPEKYEPLTKDNTELAAIQNHRERIKRLAKFDKYPPSGPKVPHTVKSKKPKIDRPTKLTAMRKKSKSNERRDRSRRTVSRRKRSNSRGKKCPRKPPVTKRAHIPKPKSPNTVSKSSKFRKSRPSTSASVLQPLPTLKESTDSKFLVLIDSLRDLHKQAHSEPVPKELAQVKN